MRDMTRSWERNISLVVRTGWRLLNAVACGRPPPIFSAMRNFPGGVFKLPSFVPTPKRELEMGNVRSVRRPRFKLSCCFGIEIAILVCALFFAIEQT